MENLGLALLVLVAAFALYGAIEPPPVSLPKQAIKPDVPAAAPLPPTTFHSLYVSHNGSVFSQKVGTVVTVTATSRVSPLALQKACITIGHMVKYMPDEVFQGVVTSHGVGLFTKAESLTVYPEYAKYEDTSVCKGTCTGNCSSSCTFDGRKYNALGGLTGSRTVVLDDNVLCDANDPHHHRANILVHEFGHLVNHYMPMSWKRLVSTAYQHAKAVKLWTVTQYAMATEGEYWAEATSAWFLASNRTDVSGGMNMCGTPHLCPTDIAARHFIRTHDPALFQVLNYAYNSNRQELPGLMKICT